jgi:Ca2+-binding EF-hand superfamily protein
MKPIQTEAKRMTRKTPFIAVTTAIAMLASQIALADQHDGQDRLDRMFDQIDLDASGTLTRDEMRRAAAARFNALDMNGDGRVEAQERRNSRGNRLAIRFDRADTDDSGTLDIHEMEAVAKLRARRRLARLDSSGDGVLSLDELRSGMQGSTQAGGAGPSSMTLADLDARMMVLFERADTDGNGVVTLQEASR